jgi:hypothetical protein
MGETETAACYKSNCNSETHAAFVVLFAHTNWETLMMKQNKRRDFTDDSPYRRDRPHFRMRTICPEFETDDPEDHSQLPF